MNINFKLKDVSVSINGEEVKVGEFSYQIEGLDMKESLAYAKEVPALIKSIKEALDTDTESYESLAVEDAFDNGYKAAMQKVEAELAEEAEKENVVPNQWNVLIQKYNRYRESHDVRVMVELFDDSVLDLEVREILFDGIKFIVLGDMPGNKGNIIELFMSDIKKISNIRLVNKPASTPF